MRPSVLMLGPLPPLTGGMATVAANLRDSDLAQLSDLITLNNGKTTPEGRSVFTGIAAQSRLLLDVLRVILRRHVQVVHIHTCALFSFWRDIVHMAAVRLVGCRVIWHLHDGTFKQFISQGNRFKRFLIRWALHRGSATIVLSRQALDSLAPHAAGVRWRVVQNGVPTDLRSQVVGDKQLRILFLGQLTERKGAYDLIAALETAAEQDVHPLLFLAGGEVVAGQREKMERRIETSPCARQIQLLGLIQGAEKERAIREANCVVLPSYAEGLPMALLEGMAAGMPAIASRVGSIPELINEGVEGFLIEPGDVRALSDRIVRLARDPKTRQRMGQAARERVINDFSLNSMAKRVYEVYCEVLGLENGVAKA